MTGDVRCSPCLTAVPPCCPALAINTPWRKENPCGPAALMQNRIEWSESPRWVLGVGADPRLAGMGAVLSIPSDCMHVQCHVGKSQAELQCSRLLTSCSTPITVAGTRALQHASCCTSSCAVVRRSWVFAWGGRAGEGRHMCEHAV